MTSRYRVLIMNMYFIPRDKNLTWGELLRSSKFRAAYKALIKKFAEEDGESEEEMTEYYFGPVLQELLDSKVISSHNVRFIVDSQFIMRDYLAMRKQSHLWYKTFWSDDQEVLYADFMKYDLT